MKKQLLFILACVFGFGITAGAQDTTDCFLDANFTYSISGGTINFTNTSTGEPAWPFYSWSIDGLTSSDENPSFPTAGFEASELVCLTVFDSLEECIDTQCMTIYFEDDTLVEDSTDCELIASFTYTVSGGTLYLTNTSTGEPAWPFYDWSVDGLYSYMENPTFPTADFEASEEVCLTVYDSLEDCMDTYCMTIYFDEDTLWDDSTDCELIASFTYTVEGGNLILTNTSTDEPAWPFYSWSVDGLYSTEENPTFPMDDFEDSEEVCLTVYDSLEDCSDTYCVTIYAEDDSTWTDSTASIISYEALSIEMYPNPAEDILNINITNANGPVQIAIYNMVGEMVRLEQYVPDNNLKTIDVSELRSGLYIVNIVDEANPEQSLQQKFLKQ